MGTRYDIDPELRTFAGFNAPMGKVLSLVGQTALSAVPMCIRRRDVRVRRFTAKAADGTAIRLRLLSPREAGDEVLPCLLYLHGGAFLHKAVPTQWRLMAKYALGARCRVAAVDYRLAPRHTYPVPVEDCLAGLAAVLERAEELYVDPAHVVIGGDSAGGSLALDTWLAAKEHADTGEAPFAGHLPRGLMLVYPVVDHRALTASMAAFDDTPIWNARKNRIMWDWYLAGADYVSPLRRAGEFAHLSCAFVEVEQLDCLHDEGVQMAGALAARGVDAELRDNPGTYHGFEFHESAAITLSSLASRIAFLRRAFA